MKSIKVFIILLICLLIPLAIGGISGFATATSITDWYVTLNKPSFNPPNYLFAPVWTTLYALMGISLFLVWKSPEGRDRNNALVIFAVQIALNFIWSFLFFKFNLIGVALVEIVLLWISILMMIIFFRRISKLAAFLQIPYLLWVSFASVLNAAIWYLN
ncbi:MAG: tryptophan-rich sensory protein [Mariniphaga sp.]|nr:tryptophan-rich sensory protein [Mariniphaga sp.]